MQYGRNLYGRNLSTASKGKAPASASAPVEDVASSTAKVQAIDAVFTALANEFRSPPRLQKTFVLTKLSYHTEPATAVILLQALSGLLARLDAARQQRKEIVGVRRDRGDEEVPAPTGSVTSPTAGVVLVLVAPAAGESAPDVTEPVIADPTVETTPIFVHRPRPRLLLRTSA
ncbi:hypothetical protein B0H14DRAFT_3903606 [Mycena olivaceomarginata]|nr:hypothetical protein B0H14DRAFT_3903606 [Mycena olivaceomarginata]